MKTELIVLGFALSFLMGSCIGSLTANTGDATKIKKHTTCDKVCNKLVDDSVYTEGWADSTEACFCLILPDL